MGEFPQINKNKEGTDGIERIYIGSGNISDMEAQLPERIVGCRRNILC